MIVCYLLFRRILLTAALLFSSAGLLAASPYTGFYTGAMYVSFDGPVPIAEYPAGPVAITVDANGNITSSGDLSGTVDSAGVITWNTPNSSGFTSGTIVDGVVSTSVSQNNNGTTLTFRISAKNSAPGFGASSSFGGKISILNPTKSLERLGEMKEGNNQLITVGPSGSYATSPDGLSWNPAGVPATLNLNSVAYGNGNYVAVGDSGAIFYSTNAVDWVARGNNTKLYLGVAYGNGLFAAVGFDGSMQTSPDGFVWTPGAQPVPGGFNGYPQIEFLNGQFVICNGTQISFSPDTVTWTPLVNINAGNIFTSVYPETKIAFQNGVYVVAGTTALAYSTDGITWEKPAFPTGRIQMVAGANGKLFAQDPNNHLWISTNAVTWKRLDNTEDIYSILFWKGRYIASGVDLLTSEDGLVWVTPEKDTLRQTILQTYSFNNNGLISGRITDQIFVGQETTNKPAAGPVGFAPVRFFFSAANLGTYWVGDHGYIYYFYSTFLSRYGVVPPLVDATLRTVASSDFVHSAIIAGDDGAMIRVNAPSGNNSPAFQLIPPVTSNDLLSGAGVFANVIFVGTEGTIVRSADPSMQQWSVLNSGTTETLRHVAQYYQNYQPLSPVSMTIAVGDNGTILTSPDGSSWTKRESGTTENLVGSSFLNLASDNRSFLIAGENGTLLQSTNGTNWTKIRSIPAPHRLVKFENMKALGEYGLSVDSVPPVSGAPAEISFKMSYANAGNGGFKGMALGNGRWVGVGNGFTAASTDGNLWRSRIVRADFDAVAYGEGRFVAVGFDGKVGYSTDGLNWTLTTQGPVPATKNFRAVTYSNGRFIAVGTGSFIMISEDGIAWTDKSLSSNVEFLAVAHNGSTVVATGKGGNGVISLNNGDSWNAILTFTGDTPGLAYGNGRFVAAGKDGYVAYSTNGQDWISKRLPLPSPVESRPTFNRTVFASGTFYSVVSNGELFTTTNGVDWVRLNSGVPNVQALLAGNGRVLLAGGGIYSFGVLNEGSPAITTQPQSRTAPAGSTTTLQVNAVGSGGLNYLWLKNGEPLADGGNISGASSASLQLSALTSLDSGEYSVAIMNDAGSVLSVTATLTVDTNSSSGQTFAAWQAGKGFTAGVNDGMNQDADADGLSNLAEFALGTDPLASVANQKPAGIQVENNGQVYAGLSFTRNKIASGVEIQVSASNSLSTASNETVIETVQDLGGDLERVTVRSVRPLAEVAELFFLVKVVVD
ncbi:MAG: immunoglobulin domain-containing protein [Verrucomicrobiota bacterium]|nr:immunoglobulin domain-containing protein [Verrucomicrobiota bacterium]